MGPVTRLCSGGCITHTAQPRPGGICSVRQGRKKGRERREKDSTREKGQEREREKGQEREREKGEREIAGIK